MLDEDTVSRGDHLSLIGGAYLDGVGDEIIRPAPVDLARVAIRRNDYVGWDSELMTSLTPAHFRREPGGESNRVIRCVDNLVVGLGACELRLGHDYRFGRGARLFGSRPVSSACSRAVARAVLSETPAHRRHSRVRVDHRGGVTERPHPGH